MQSILPNFLLSAQHPYVLGTLGWQEEPGNQFPVSINNYTLLSTALGQVLQLFTSWTREQRIGNTIPQGITIVAPMLNKQTNPVFTSDPIWNRTDGFQSFSLVLDLRALNGHMTSPSCVWGTDKLLAEGLRWWWASEEANNINAKDKDFKHAVKF